MQDSPVTEKPSRPVPNAARAADRGERLEKALRANLARRKAQARARTAAARPPER